MLSKLAEYKKLVVFVVTVVANAVALNVVPEDGKVWAFLLLNVAGAYGVFAAQNADPKEPVA